MFTLYGIKGKQPKDYVALEITVNFVTGERPAGINPREDKGLICLSGWQNLDAGVEMRLVIDDRDVSQYEGVPGITVHKGATKINSRVKELFKPLIAITDAQLFSQSIIQKGINLKDIDPTLAPEEQLRRCREKGALGIRVMEPETVG